MSVDSSIISQMRTITISREYGSGGGEIARRLAKCLGWRLIDHEAVIRVAQELGVSEAEAAAHDEYAEGLVSRILTSMQAVDPALYSAGSVSLTTNSQEYHKALEKVVTSAATAGHVVIVGRGAQVILAGRRDVLYVRVVASIEQRIPYVMRREGLNQDAARKRIQTKDRDRVRYLQTQYRHHPEDPHLYDLVLSSNIIDLDSIVELINLALERKASQLSTPTENLGPGTGMTRYPTQPSDFRLPESTT
jgi:CMP/dCMP kinase